MSLKGNLTLAAFVTFLGVAQIASTYPVLSQTYDEAYHIVAGMEWLQHHRYSVELLHPPLARVAVALGPFLAGRRLMNTEVNSWTWFRDSDDLLHGDGSYFRNLTFARLGVLPFFLIATAIVYAWTWRVFGATAALLGTVLFTTLPIILAHSGIATTDMPGTAMLLAALFAFSLWLEDPTLFRNFMCGLCLALAILSKFSNLLFLPVCALTVLLLRYLAEKRNPAFTAVNLLRRVTTGCFAGLVAFAVTWSGYRFSLGPLTTIEERPHSVIDRQVGNHGWLHEMAYAALETPVFPLTEILTGVLQLKSANDEGRANYILGAKHKGGVWYFFPTGVAVKTPIPFLIFAVAGVIFLVRKLKSSRDWRPLVPLLCAVAILSVSVPSNINIGVRHVLSIYPFLTIVGAGAAAVMWKAGRSTAVLAVVLLLWQFISTLSARPDFLAYFNQFAGSKPEQILVDSDLDWGQDLARLTDALKTRDIKTFSMRYFGTADPDRLSVPASQELVPHQCTTGWIAISISSLKLTPGYQWLERYEPVALVGKTIRLYHIPDNSCHRISNRLSEPRLYG